MKPTHHEYLLRIGKIIKAKRKLLGMKQDALASATGLTQVEISQIENGLYTGLKHATVIDINAVLKIPPDELIPPPNK